MEGSRIIYSRCVGVVSDCGRSGVRGIAGRLKTARGRFSSNGLVVECVEGVPLVVNREHAE